MSTTNPRRPFILALTVLISFAGSFYFSAFPDIHFKLFGKSPLLIGFPPEFFLPLSARRAIFELSGEVLNSVPLPDKETWKKSHLDAVLIPRSWIESKKQEIKSDFFSAEISTDFQFIEDRTLRALPLFWKLANKTNNSAANNETGNETGQENIQLLYFVIQNPFRIEKPLKKALISQIVQSLWTQETGWASTLATLDDFNFPSHLKAQNFRNYSLAKLKLEKFSNSPSSTTTTSSPPPTIPAPKKKKHNSKLDSGKL